MMGPLRLISILALVALPLGGCRPSETDVTRVARYNFSSFAGTAWKTRVKVALGDVKAYTGAHHLELLAPWEFDRADPNYWAPTHFHIIRILPVGTRIRIDRLMFDNGEGSQDWVTASLDDGTHVYVSWGLLAENEWIGGGHPGVPHPPGSKTSTAWGVNPKYLESDAPPRNPGKGGK